MNADVKAEWVEALRSGEYEQGESFLRRTNGEFCCLGVLCELAVKHGVIPEPTLEPNASVYYYIDESVQDSYDAWLPPKVKEWAGIEADEGRMPEPLPFKNDEKGTTNNLTGLNDNGYTFAEIADIIETVEIE